MALNIKQVASFQLKVLRIAGFLEFLQQVEKLAKAFRNRVNGESQFPAKVDDAFSPFISGVVAVDTAYRQSNASDYTQQIADEDTRRDNLYKQLVNLVKMYMKFSFDKEKKEAGEYLWNIIRKYGVNVNENYHEESVKLQQMLQELKRNYQAELRIKKLGMESLVEQLDTANEAVRTMMAQRNEERLYMVKAALTTARAEADEAYHDFILALNSAAVMDENTSRFDELISQINELIKYYRQYVVPKKGSTTSGDDEGDGGSDESSDSKDSTDSTDSKDNGKSTDTSKSDSTGDELPLGGGGSEG